MLLRKNSQNVPKDLVFVQIAILWSPDIKILSVFDRQVTLLKFLEISF